MKPLFLSLLLFVPLPVCFGQDTEPRTSLDIPANVSSRFDELATRFKALQEQFYNHKPREGEDGVQRFLADHPMNSMVTEFLSLEEQSRGTSIGFASLYHLILVAASVGDADYPVTKGKIAALNILSQHYHDYPDVDTTFRYLFSGARISESKAFLRDLIASSRHEYVRANAMYELANYLALEANLPAICESHLAVLDREDPENEAQIKVLEKFTANLKDIAIERNRAESLSLIEQIRNEHTEELVPPRADVRTPVIIKVERGKIDGILKTKRQRIADRLPAVQFELNHSIGQQAPPIDANDATGKPMRLADFHGKVVVVMFSFKGCGPCEAMYPDNRQLIEELSGEPFAFVGVQGDDTIDTVRESLESETITWRVWWDGEDKRLSNQWNIQGWPSTFLLDQRGVIRFRDLRGKELEKAVRSLLKKEAE